MIWKGTEEEVLSFFENINRQHKSIKFDYNYSKSEISFLDTVVFTNTLNALSTKLYTKPTDRPAYLHQKSYHPKSLKDNRNSIPNLQIDQLIYIKSHTTLNH